MVRELMTDMGLISIREDAKDYYDKEKAQELSESAIPRVETKRSVGQRYHVFQV